MGSCCRKESLHDAAERASAPAASHVIYFFIVFLMKKGECQGLEGDLSAYRQSLFLRICIRHLVGIEDSGDVGEGEEIVGRHIEAQLIHTYFPCEIGGEGIAEHELLQADIRSVHEVVVAHRGGLSVEGNLASVLSGFQERSHIHWLPP